MLQLKTFSDIGSTYAKIKIDVFVSDGENRGGITPIKTYTFPNGYHSDVFFLYDDMGMAKKFPPMVGTTPSKQVSCKVFRLEQPCTATTLWRFSERVNNFLFRTFKSGGRLLDVTFEKDTVFKGKSYSYEAHVFYYDVFKIS